MKDFTVTVAKIFETHVAPENDYCVDLRTQRLEESAGAMSKAHVVSFSGGIGSFITAKRVVEKFGNTKTILVFSDTNIEDEDLYRFVKDSVRYLRCTFVHLKNDETPWDVFRRVEYMGNSRVAHCSKELKSKPFKNWLFEAYTPDECILYFGFDWTEENRLTKVQKHYGAYKCEAPLMDPPLLSKKDMFEVVRSCGIEIPRLYELGFQHNNCGGFCVKAGQAHFKNLLDKMPDRYKLHELSQEKLFKDLPKTNRPFIRMTIDKKLHYLSLKQFREHLEKGKEIDRFDYGGCGCFVEDE